MEIPGIFSQPIPTAGRSRKQWAAILLLSLGLGIAFYYFREPILNFATTAWTNISKFFSGLTTNPFFANLFTWMTANPIPTLGGIASITTALLTFVKLRSETKAKTDALQAQLQTQGSLTNYQNQMQEYITAKESQIQQLQTQANSRGSDTLQSALNESQGLVTNQATQIRSLQDQITALNNLIMLKETQVIEKIVVK
jgi:hypothetical protein